MMVGDPSKHDTKFDMENYEEFYEHHNFEPIPEKLCTTVNEVIPRLGWAFDKIEELEAKTLLDLGCLDGSFALTVGHQLGLTVTGVDLTQDGLILPKNKLRVSTSELTSIKGLSKNCLPSSLKKDASLKS